MRVFKSLDLTIIFYIRARSLAESIFIRLYDDLTVFNTAKLITHTNDI